MVRDGATFVASGVYTKHLLDQLQARQTNQQHLELTAKPELAPAPAITAPMLEKPTNGSQKRILSASWTLKGSPGPMPGE
jgi:hypothetical protein